MKSLGSLILPVLGFTLVILKVLGVITLGWAWVLAPFWIPMLIGLCLIPFGIIILVLGLIVEGGTKSRAAARRSN